MGFGGASTIVASNIVMLFLIPVTVTRLMRLMSIPRADLGVENRWVFPAAMSMVLVMLEVQTAFYIAARFLKQFDGPDLWAAHPAPAVVSLLLTFSIYWIMPAYFAALGMDRRQRRRRCVGELAALGVCWLVLQTVLA